MTAGPLRRMTAAIGLIALVPIAGMVMIDALTPEAAAIRAALIAVAVVAVGNGIRLVLTKLLRRVERREGDAPTERGATANGTSAQGGDRVPADAGSSSGRRRPPEIG